jgi:hypothetical protein
VHRCMEVPRLPAMMYSRWKDLLDHHLSACLPTHFVQSYAPTFDIKASCTYGLPTLLTSHTHTHNSVMSALPTNTHAWYVSEWEYRRFAYKASISISDTADDWSTTLTFTMLPSQSGIVVPPDDHTVTVSENYVVSGCEISLMIDPDQILFRRSPMTQSESSVETKTLIPPAEIPRPTSTGDGEDQTASVADVTTSSGSSGSESSASTMQSGASIPSAAAASANESSSPGLGGGAIAGIAIGGILVLALIIGGWFFWRRRKRSKAQTFDVGDDEQARGDRGSGVPPPQYSPQEKQLYIPDHHQEMPGDVPTPAQELDPTQSIKYATHAARHSTSKVAYQYEPAHELHPEARPAELPYGGEEHVSPLQQHAPAAVVDEGDVIEETGRVSKAVSADVEAQRRREMEWLDMEEERIRKKRETLSMQTSGKG